MAVVERVVDMVDSLALWRSSVEGEPTLLGRWNEPQLLRPLRRFMRVEAGGILFPCGDAFLLDRVFEGNEQPACAIGTEVNRHRSPLGIESQHRSTTTARAL